MSATARTITIPIAAAEPAGQPDAPPLVGREEMISPGLAMKYLETSRGNRNIRPRTVAGYVDDILAGRHQKIHAGLAFDAEGRLADGHHRLHAVVKAGVAVKMFVVRGLTADAVKVLDAGLPRSSRDAFHMAGAGDYSEAEISTARCIEFLPAAERPAAKNHLSRQELLDVIDRHHEAITWAVARLERVAGSSRGVRACVARAYYHVDRERLAQFCGVVKTGLPMSFPAAEDVAAVSFSRWLASTRGLSGRNLEIEKYRKCTTCILAFLERRPMARVYGCDTDQFPLPAPGLGFGT